MTISVIGVLVSISVFGLQGARESARDSRRKADLETLRSAMELYRSDCGVYPPSVTFGGTLNGLSGNSSCQANTYLDQVPDDPGDANYYYNRTSNTTYVLCASLEASTTTSGPVGSCGGCGSGYPCEYAITDP